MIDNIWDRVSITLAAYVKATYPSWDGVSDPRFMQFITTRLWAPEPKKPKRAVIVRKAKTSD